MKRIHKSIEVSWLTRASFILSAVILGLTSLRLFFGVSLSDEAFYVALPLRFVLGDRFFIDDQSVVQLSAILTYPVTKFFLMVRGSTDGIILYFRFLYLVMCLVSSLLSYRTLKQVTTHGESILISALLIAFIPWCLPSVSYNTMGSHFFLMGCLVCSYFNYQSPKPSRFLIPGILHGLAPVAVPAYVFPVAAFLLVLFFQRQRHRGAILFWYFLGLLLVGIAILPILSNLWFSDFAAFKVGLHFAGERPPWYRIVRFLVRKQLWTLSTVALIYFLRRKWDWDLVGILVLVPIAALFAVADQGAAVSLLFLADYASVGPLILLLCKDRKTLFPLFKLIWIPSFVAGIATAWGSTVGVINVGFGLIGGALFTSAAIVVFLRQVYEGRYRYVSLGARFGWLVVLIGFFLFHQTDVFFETPVATLRTRVAEGPYRGLFTSSAKAQVITELYRDLRNLPDRKEPIYFYRHFPAGYLLAMRRPAAPLIWASELESDLSLLESKTPFHVVNMKPSISAFEIYDIPSKSIQSVTQGRAKLLVARDTYEIFEVPKNPKPENSR